MCNEWAYTSLCLPRSSYSRAINDGVLDKVVDVCKRVTALLPTGVFQRAAMPLTLQRSPTPDAAVTGIAQLSIHAPHEILVLASPPVSAAEGWVWDLETTVACHRELLVVVKASHVDVCGRVVQVLSRAHDAAAGEPRGL
eukprot:968810-Rhodomonas_salina.1